MSDILLVVFAVVFVLGVAINIHEFGHFAVARLLGMRVEAFSFFGIGPRIWGFKRGHTDYRISAIPLGAYVKLYGDEATAPLEGGESEGEKVPDEELYELRPRWQKFLVMVGGPFMNIVLALAIPFGIAVALGVPSVPAPIVGSVVEGGAAEKAGLVPGDRIVEFDGVKDPTWMRIREDASLLPGKETPIVVEREGKKIPLTIVPGELINNGNKFGDIQMEPDMGVEAVVVGSIQQDMPAAQSGLQIGDQVTSVDGKPVRTIEEMQRIVQNSKGEPITIVVNRNGETKEIQTNAKKTEDDRYLIGIAFDSSGSREPVGILGATSFAFNENWRILRLTGKALGQMFAGERSVKEGGIAGPVGIVQIIATIVRDAGIAGLLPILMVISLNLGIFNLLPIPLLDGGQIAVLGIEAILAMFGLTLSVAVKEKIQLAGLAIILLLMVVVLYFDISRIIG
ncbi:MAG: RIP metalloprotease RseP [Acidobacteria bacterium]|nr:MAG: RIP metalloprotease RseP [Acidobacteriota bacterium]REK02058.1 MAG: RIP metalloprotease RseP [Acidobacteriota bacterium]REK15016.1 MAG: RIP metalloprotease RseP [Acidobacteriota bacterium]REK45730.1 MAG: RIP metalloprotease RseP [Acidobacteriota bacterium]